MVLSFNTQPFSFEIDGSPYMLPVLGFGDLETSAAITSAADVDRPRLIRELFEAKADARTLEAIDKLAVADVIKLVKAWVGIGEGESETSGE